MSARRGSTGAARTTMWLTVILVVGALLRGGYLAERRHAPDYSAPLADAAFHDYWARGWSTGNWTPPEGEPDPNLSSTAYLRPPGYPFFLSLLYRAFGPSPLGPRIAQAVLGLLSVALAFLFGRAVLGRTPGLILAAFAATYWASIYFEGELQAPVLLQAAGWVVLILLLAAARSGSAWIALAAGIALGCTALVRANVLAFVPVAAVWLGWTMRRRAVSFGPTATSVTLLLVGTLAALAPVTARNYRVSGELVPVSINGAVNLYIGNNETADGTSATIPDLAKLTGRPGWNWFRYGEIVRGLSRRAGTDLSYGDVSREFIRLARDWITAHPREFAALSLKRALLFWGPDEISNNKAIRLEKESSRVLAPFPAFPFVLAFSLLGVWLAARDIRAGGRSGPMSSRTGTSPSLDGAALVLTGLYVGTMYLSYVPFLAAARFRAPLVPFLFVFGAWAIARLAAFVVQRDFRALAVSAVAIAILVPVLSPSSGENEVDRAWWHTDRGVALKRQERVAEARSEFEAALAANPGYIDAHVQLGELLHEIGDPGGALEHYLTVWRQRPDRTELMMKSAVILLDQAMYEEAAELLQQAVRIVPDSPDVHFEYGRALIELGHHEEGIEALTRSLALGPGSVPTLINRGIAYTMMGRLEEAIADLELAVETNRFSSEAFYHLGNALHASGQWEQAMAAFEQASRIGLVYVEPRVHIGNLHGERGNWKAAIEAYEDALRINANHVTARYNLSAALANAGRLREAIEVLEAALKVEPNHALCRERLRQMRQILERGG